MGQVKDAGVWSAEDSDNPTNKYVNHALLVKNGYGLEIGMQLIDTNDHYLYIRAIYNNNPVGWYRTDIKLTKV